MRHVRLLSLLILIALAGAVDRAQAQTTFTVDTLGDVGHGTCAPANCTLRDAITAANATAGADTIAFNIAGGGVQTIALLAALPAIAEAVTIDGYTQPGTAANTNATGAIAATLLIQLSGTPAYFTHGLEVASSNVTIRGLVINGFINDIYASQGANVRVQGNFLGTTPDGSAAPSFSSDRGVLVDVGATGVTIGGPTPETRNLISGHTANGVGIDIGDPTAASHTVAGNLIGTNAAGASAVPNQTGILVYSIGAGVPGSVVIGGGNGATGNVISGNGTGILVQRPAGSRMDTVAIFHNRIGFAAAADTALPNTGPGVRVEGSVIVDVQLNDIGYNTGPAVSVPAGASVDLGVNVTQNRIVANGGGIDLGADGRTANDADDTDAGPNDLQNFPVLTRVTYDSGTSSTRFEGILTSTPGASMRLDFYSNGTTHRPGGMDAETYLFSLPVTVSGTGLYALDHTRPISLPVGTVIVATATNGNGANKTSEISDALLVRPPGHRIAGTVTYNAIPLAGATVTLSGGAAGSTITNAYGEYEFDGLQTNTYTVTATMAGYAFTPPSHTVVGIAADETFDFASSSVPLTYTVNSASDPGGDGVCDLTECTLREAITAANDHPGPDTITFAIQPFDTTHTITLATQLPPVLDATVIDGYTQPGATPNTNATGGLNANLPIRIDLNALPFGIAIGAGPSIVRGLAIYNASLATLAVGNVSAPVNDVTIEGNYFGLTPDAVGPRAGYSGVFVLTNVHELVIGGTTPAARNIVSNFGGPGISLFTGDGTSSQVRVVGNLLGTTVDGLAALPNESGVMVGASDFGDGAAFRIGGPTAAERNVISGNIAAGVVVDYNQGIADSITDVVIENNHIGLAADGTSPLGNGTAGVMFVGSPRATVTGNEIAHNTGAGVLVSTQSEGSRVLVTQNAIHANSGLAIDLGGDGRTANDPEDADSGSNSLQNFPTLLTAQAFINGTATVEGRLDSAPEQTYIVELFATEAPGTAGLAARRYVGTTQVTTDNTGVGLFSLTVPGVSGTDVLSATATNDLDQTSEVSDALAVTPIPLHSISGTVTFDGGPLANVTIELQGTSTATSTTDAAGHYQFDGLLEGGAFTVVPTSTEYGFTPPQAEVAALAADAVRDFTAIWLSRSRFLTEGATGSFWQTTVSVMNPTDAPASGEVRFMRADGDVKTLPLTLPAHGHITIDPEQVSGLEQAAFATEVRSQAPLVASRTTHWGQNGELGAHADQSIEAPRQSWYFGEGATGCFSLFYMLQNANAQPAEVDIEFVRRAPAAPILRHYTIDPHSRFTLPVHELPGLEMAEVSARIDVTNGVPILAGRAMYSSCSGDTWRGGHASAGSPAPATSWFLAEGATGSFFDLYVLIANFAATDAEVDVTYLLADGSTITRPHVIPARSRVTIDVAGEDPALAQAEVSTRVTSTNHIPVVVERAQWWPHDAWYEGHSSVGTTETGVEWHLAGIEVGGTHESAAYLLIANTGDTDGAAQVRLLFDDGTTADLPQPVQVRAHSRTTVPLAEAFPAAQNARFGAIITSLGATPAPIVVELSTYGTTMKDGAPVFWGAGSNTVATRVR